MAPVVFTKGSVLLVRSQLKFGMIHHVAADPLSLDAVGELAQFNVQIYLRAFAGHGVGEVGTWDHGVLDVLELLVVFVGKCNAVHRNQRITYDYFKTVHARKAINDADQSLVYRGQLDDSRPGNDKPVTGADLRAP